MSCSTSIPQKVLRQASEAAAATQKAAKLEKDLAVVRERAEALQQRCSSLELRAEQAEASSKQATEAVAIATAERKLVDEAVARADAVVNELRAERSTLVARANEAETMSRTMQQQKQAADEARASAHEGHSVAQAERRLLDERLAQLVAELGELKATSATARQTADERIAALKSERDELRTQRASLQESLSVSVAERRLHDEATARSTAQLNADLERLNAQLSAADARTEALHAAAHKKDEAIVELQRALSVCQAEKQLLQDLLGRMQQVHMEERTTLQAALNQAVASSAQLSSRLESSEEEAQRSGERLSQAQADCKALADRCAQSESKLHVVQGEHQTMVSERRKLDETVRQNEAQIHAMTLERAAARSLEERFRDMQSQRDAAETERTEVQEEMAQVQARQAGFEERAKAAEEALKLAQTELSVEQSKEREREERCKEFQRQRDAAQRERVRVQEQLAIAAADARATGEREHALQIRTNVLEKELQSATSRALEVAGEIGSLSELTVGSDSASRVAPSPTATVLAVGGSPSSPTGSNLLAMCGALGAEQPGASASLSSSTKLSIQQALQGLERVNARWTKGGK